MRKYILNVPLDDLSLKDIREKIIHNERVFQVFVNIHKIVQFNKNNNLQQILSGKKCVFSVDGKWVKWLANLNGFFPKERFGGLEVIDTFFALAQRFNFRLYLLGGVRENLNKAEELLKAKFPRANIVGAKDGFFKYEEEVITDIREKKPEILFLALPSPKKELLGYRIFQEVESLKYVAGVGGAFDIIVGKAKRAPLWIQGIGLEWLYRCLQEPKRLFKRYLSDGLDLLLISLKQATRNYLKK